MATYSGSSGGFTLVDSHPCEFGPIDTLALSWFPLGIILLLAKAAAFSDHRIMPKISLRSELNHQVR